MATSFFQSIFRPELIRMDLAATTKDAAIRELLDILDTNHLLPNRAEAEKAVFDREQCMSTGMENGIAIPHGKSNSLNTLVAALAIKREGLDFQSIDQKPATLFVITLSPVSQTATHLRFMAEISKLLRDSQVRKYIHAAQSPEDVLKLLTR